MAKSARKTSKTSNNVAPVTSALHVAMFGVLWGFVESADASQSRSKAAMIALETAYTSMDAAEFATMVAAEFGNGARGKANVKGALIDALEARCKAEGKAVPVSARGFVSQVRTVALNFGNADVRKAANESGTRAAYDVAKPKAEADAKPKAEADAKPKTITLPELIGELIGTLGGDVQLMRIVESAFIAARKPIHAKAVHDVAVKLATLAA